MHFFDLMQPMFVNRMCPGKSWKKRIFESWKTMEFGLCKSWKILEKSILISVRTLIKVILKLK